MQNLQATTARDYLASDFRSLMLRAVGQGVTVKAETVIRTAAARGFDRVEAGKIWTEVATATFNL